MYMVSTPPGSVLSHASFIDTASCESWELKGRATGQDVKWLVRYHSLSRASDLIMCPLWRTDLNALLYKKDLKLGIHNESFRL